MHEFIHLPEELQGCCARALDTSSAGSFGQVSKACKTLVEGRLAEEKAVHEAPYVEFSSRHGEALAAMCRIPDGPKLIKFTDGGRRFTSARALRIRRGGLGPPTSTSRRTLRRSSTGSTGALSPMATRSRRRLRGRPIWPQCRDGRCHARALSVDMSVGSCVWDGCVCAV